MISKKEMKEKIDRNLIYDIAGTYILIVMFLASLVWNRSLTLFFIGMIFLFYNSYLITKREKQILEVLG